ncbi:hypothetical protein SS50377_20878 [Spironucleus salmonicida]|uniref:Uncharacterized protein n=1 Tax=Spironucleus salmonicida TaxID=348837 RepID=V6LRZ6_9EUKA|nr:hypothetical protein SS50377_20878 [Spironucleus salmonicida]|eukprot:EST43554.1 hypothetical protein SS50377_16592 [Spironucleus salmonicida]
MPTIYERLDILLPQETVHLIPELNHLTLELFDLLRTTPTQQSIDYACKVAQQPHWMRKLTAYSVLKNFQSETIKLLAFIDIQNEKREVRDAAALCLSFQDVQEIVFTNEKFTTNEGMAVFCGYVLEKSFRDDALSYLLNNLKFNSPVKTDNDYVHWYTCRALCRTFYAQKHDFSTCYENVFQMLSSDDQKTRKAASEAFGILLSQFEFDFSLQTLISKIEISSAFSAQTHGILQAISVAVQVHTQTHDFYVKRKSQTPQIETIQQILRLYMSLPAEMSVAAQSGIYQNALILAIQPANSFIKPLLEHASPLQIDAGITASIYMQKYFRANLDDLYLDLYILTFHSAKPISVLAKRALCGVKTVRDCEQVVHFTVQRMKSDSPDARECAVRMIEDYMKHHDLAQNQYEIVKKALLSCAFNETGGQLSQMPRKAAFDTFEQLVGKISLDDVQDLTIHLFRERGTFSPNLARFLALNSKSGLATVAINAFDAVCADIADSCRTCVSLINSDLQEELLTEIDFYSENDILALNGISRLIYALKLQNFPVEKLSEKLSQVRELAENDWFDEIFSIHDAYFQAISGPFCGPCGAEKLRKTDVEFDDSPHETAAFMRENAQNSALIRAVLGDFELQNLTEIFLDGQIQPEFKQLLAAGTVGLGVILPPKKELDVRANEVVVKATK